jgi:hypothetical protein
MRKRLSCLQKHHFIFIICALLHITFLHAQTSNAHNLFIPSFNDPASTVYRSAKGTPGPQYWQNSADYLIHATLNERDSSITGNVSINYANNSPDKLDYLWLQLDQNLFEPKSRGALTTPVSGDRFDVRGYDKGGYHITSVSIIYRGISSVIQPVISDARMQVRLPKPLLPKGDKITIKVNYSFSIPSHGSDRLGRFTTPQGQTYEIAQWYPRMCVYDDVQGWNTLPYMGLGEFYCEYGNYDYYITAPAEMIVYGSGDLQNKTQVLTAEQIKRLSLAATSDRTIDIIKPAEIGKPQTRPTTKGMLTWHFTMNNTRDVAWTASKALVWDAARVNLPSGRKAIAMSAYPLESLGDSAYSRSTEYLKHSIEIYSKAYFEYPWNSAVNIGGSVTGMEYPGIIYCNYKSKRARLWDLITHEIGHNWFPMIVGSNERKYMWQDEGFNTFINYYAASVFNKGEYANDTSLVNRKKSLYDSTLVHHSPLMTPSEAMSFEDYRDYYRKTAWGLELLRNVVVGAERFDYAFKKYTEAWAFKHPTPYDFFHTINNAAGEDLNWFWKSWFFSAGKLDQSISMIKRTNDSTFITIENKGEVIMPVIAKLYQSNGTSEIIKLPVEIWQHGNSWTFKYISKAPLDKIVLDPENVLPDINKTNNEWNFIKGDK